MAMKRLKISKGGQVSVPAAIRHRWNTNTVVVEDLGEKMLLRPAADDPVEAAFGAFKTYAKKPLEEVRKQVRGEELLLERRRRRSQK